MNGHKAGIGLWCAVAALGCGGLQVPLVAPAVGGALPDGRADLHMHVIMREALHPFFQGEPGEGVLAHEPGQRFTNQVEPEDLRRAGVRLVFAALWPPNALRPGRSALGEALHQLERLEDFAHDSPEFVLALSAGTARQELTNGQLVLIPSIEGGEGIRRVEDVDVLYAAGARSITLVHFFDNALAGAADDQFGPLGHLTNGRDEGLTALGVEVVRRMMDLGILIDVAHASDQTISDVLELTGPAGVPIVYSHTGAGWANTRCLSAPLARRLGAQGGLIGIGLFRSLQVVPVEERWKGFEPGTCDDDVAYWLYYTRQAGAEAVVLGSDFNSVIARARPGGSCAWGIRNTGDLPALFAALQAHGVEQARLDSSADRVLRVLESVEAHARPEVQRAARGLKPPHETLFPSNLP